ncbi:non-LTR retroelement reverse transcriptase [Tanacetum coccineum]
MHQPDGVGSKRYHVVPYRELDGIPVAFVARFGVISKGLVLLNTDGSSRGNPGGGGILQDSRGRFLEAFAENYGICTVIRSEILALLQGIIMTMDVGIRKLIIKDFVVVLAVLVTGASQSRQHVSTSSIHIESCKSPTAEQFEVDSGRIYIRHCEY